MTSLTGTLALTRFILRRDRIRILVWIVTLVALAALTTVGIEGLFPTQAALDQTAAATVGNAAMIAFNGPAQGLNTVGGQVAFQFGSAGLVLVGLMSIFMVGRLTRGEEEGGRLEVVRSLPVGIHANTLAAVLTVARFCAQRSEQGVAEGFSVEKGFHRVAKGLSALVKRRFYQNRQCFFRFYNYRIFFSC